jgi:hypothetical protein
VQRKPRPTGGWEREARIDKHGTPVRETVPLPDERRTMMPDDTTILVFDPHVLAAILCCFIAMMISFGVFIANGRPLDRSRRPPPDVPPSGFP